MKKQVCLALCIAVVTPLLLCSCKEKTRDDYIAAACGYYETADSYLKIGEKSCEEKNKTTGEVLREGEIINTELELLEDSKTKLSFIFYRDAYPRIVVEINKAGKVYDSSGTELTRISESKYNQIKAADSLQQPATAESSAANSGVEEANEKPSWYEQEYTTYQYLNDLGEIETLFATGKREAAIQKFNASVVAGIKEKVPKLIQKREYWLAQNYLAMFQKKYPNTSGCSYPFTFQYLQENYVNKTSRIRISNGIDALVYPYYNQISAAARADTVAISKEAAVYKVNEALIQNHYPTVTGLRSVSNEYMYLTDIVENYESVLFFIVNPYTAAVITLPANYFFTDGVYIPPAN